MPTLAVAAAWGVAVAAALAVVVTVTAAAAATVAVTGAVAAACPSVGGATAAGSNLAVGPEAREQRRLASQAYHCQHSPSTVVSCTLYVLKL